MKPDTTRASAVVIVAFTGAQGIKRRPALVLSSDLYHRERPDLILGVVTSNVAWATASTDYRLEDWAEAGLRKPSAFRAYLGMAESASATVIGYLSPRNWDAVRERVRRAMELTPPLSRPDGEAEPAHP